MLYFLATVNSTAMNTDVQISFQNPAFTFENVFPEMELLDHMVTYF